MDDWLHTKGTTDTKKQSGLRCKLVLVVSLCKKMNLKKTLRTQRI